jgi:hypothetical protein
MWFGRNWDGYGQLRIRVYVDGESTASIDMELYLGHSIGSMDDAAPWGIKRMGRSPHKKGRAAEFRRGI